MRYLSLTLLATSILYAQAPPTTRLGTILRTNGILVHVYGTPSAPTLDPKPALTKYIQFAQADAQVSWAATTPDSAIYGRGDYQCRKALPSRPRALAISPDGNSVAILLDDTVAVFLPNTVLHAFAPARSLATPVIPPGTPVELAVTNNRAIWISTPDASYVAGMDGKFFRAPSHFTLFHRTKLAYDTTNNVVSLVRFDSIVNKFFIEKLGTADDGIVAPTGLTISADDKTVWVSLKGAAPTTPSEITPSSPKAISTGSPSPDKALPANGVISGTPTDTASYNLVSITLATRAVHPFTLPSAGAIRSTTQPGIFFWNETTLLDTTGAEPRLVSIPAPVR